MMRQNVKRRPKTRSSKRACEEKFCCPFVDSEAKYFCEDCKSAQCQTCESNIHSTKLKYDFHYRRHLPVVPETDLCQAKRVNLVCQERNYPDLWCEQCQIQLCYTCFDIYHSLDKRRNHVNVSVVHYLKKQEEEQQIATAEFSGIYQDTVTDMIKPQAPFYLGDEEDSVTVCSFPQESSSVRNIMDFTANNTRFQSDHSNSSIPDICQGAGFSSVREKPGHVDSASRDSPRSFLLVDDQEIVQVHRT